jgi:hypothetical protein
MKGCADRTVRHAGAAGPFLLEFFWSFSCSIAFNNAHVSVFGAITLSNSRCRIVRASSGGAMRCGVVNDEVSQVMLLSPICGSFF